MLVASSNQLILLVICCMAHAQTAISQTVVVLTQNDGIISSPENISDVDYVIRAPIGKKIELTFESFTFIPCKLDDQTCTNNHHLIVTKINI